MGERFQTMLSVVSMFWSQNPFIVQPELHAETNVMAVPSERVQHRKGGEGGGGRCRDKNDLEECVLSQAESNMYNSSFAMLFCGPDAFGNCTIPQVRINSLS